MNGFPSYTVLAFFQNLGPGQILLILFIILLLFGAKRLPELARSVGKSLREFKKATTEVEDEFRSAMDETDSSVKAPRKEDVKEPAGKIPAGKSEVSGHKQGGEESSP